MRCYLKILQRYPICLKEISILKILFKAEIKYKLNTLLWESRCDDCVLTTIFCFVFFRIHLYFFFFYYKTILLASTGYSDSKLLWVWHRASNVRIAFPAFWTRICYRISFIYKLPAIINAANSDMYTTEGGVDAKGLEATMVFYLAVWGLSYSIQTVAACGI